MNSESERDANPGPSTESEEQLSGPPQRAPGPDNCPISPSEEAEEPSQARSPEFWMSPERTTLYFGDWVLAKTSKHAKPWPARIEFVNGDLCPTRRQHRLPHMGTVPYDLDFKWPVFFYGTHNVAWVSDRNLKRMIKEENPIPEFDPKLQFGTRFERAVFEFYATPWVGLEEWSDPEPRWEDSVKDFKKKIQSPRLMGWAKQIPPHDKFVPEHWKNHIRVESETGEQSDEDEDPVQVKYKEALFKLHDMQAGDIVGAVYPDHNNDLDFFIGVIKKKNEEEPAIDVNFASLCRGTGEYVENAKDQDTIPLTRQGYLYFHAKGDAFEFKSSPKSGKLLFKAKEKNFKATLRMAELTWKLHVAQISKDVDGAEMAKVELDQHQARIQDMNSLFLSSTRARVTE